MIRPEAYRENGYKNRDDYLNSLSEDYGVPHRRCADPG